ncbi:MAG: PilT/PilU family type 4a pilus ATPase [Patescibacteria group bacterium]
MPQTNTVTLDAIFRKGQEGGASDVHLIAGKPPLQRIDGILEPLEGFTEPLNREEVKRMIETILTPSQRERFEREREIDLSYQLATGARFRVNCHFERDNVGLVARIIPERIPTMEEVQMPAIADQLIRLSQGIILFTGPTGSGKSTSLASMIETINRERPVHIVTLEDPIEFLYQSKTSVIRQRQFGTDFLSFAEALRRILRQDPDVILVGEMRDLETIAAALTLAETGHLVFATLHTPNAAQTIDRIIDVFPPHQQVQIRLQLSLSLTAVISQRLIPRKGGGRCAVREVLLNSPAVANIIRDNRIAELPNVLQTSANEGMITVERDVARLLHEGYIEREIAQQYVADPKVLKQVSGKGGFWK